MDSRKYDCLARLLQVQGFSAQFDVVKTRGGSQASKRSDLGGTVKENAPT